MPYIKNYISQITGDNKTYAMIMLFLVLLGIALYYTNSNQKLERECNSYWIKNLRENICTNKCFAQEAVPTSYLFNPNNLSLSDVK